MDLVMINSVIPSNEFLLLKMDNERANELMNDLWMNDFRR